MALAEIKTKATTASVDKFIEALPDAKKRQDAKIILELMKKISKQEPKLWGSSIIGFGEKRFKSPTTDREVDWFIIGFSPRKTALSIYLGVSGIKPHAAALKKLGKHKTGVGCLYVNKLEDIDLKVLTQMIKDSV